MHKSGQFPTIPPLCRNSSATLHLLELLLEVGRRTWRQSPLDELAVRDIDIEEVLGEDVIRQILAR